MRKGVGLIIFCELFILIQGYAFGATALPVSPGDNIVEVVAGSSCPTFSWSAGPDAATYRLEVYELLTTAVLSHDQMAEVAKPVLSKEIGAPALTWTPSEGQCLGRGGQYVWYVQGADIDGAGRWSGGLPFRVAAGDLTVEQRNEINDAIKKYLASDAGRTALLQAVKGAAQVATAWSVPTVPAEDRQAAARNRAAAITPSAAVTGLAIGQSGWVGVGTDIPASALDVGGTLTVSNSNGQWTTSGWQKALVMNQAYSLLWQKGAAGFARGIGSSTDGVLYFTRSAADDYSGVAYYDMVIDAGGNVGIGTGSPTAPLEVGGAIKSDKIFSNGLRIGSETGTGEAPYYPSDSPGLIIRRVLDQNNGSDGSVIARTDDMLLERDGTKGGIKVVNISPDSYIRRHISCHGVTNSGAAIARFFYVGDGATQSVFSDSDNVIFVTCSFGNFYGSQSHTTQVTIMRYYDPWYGFLGDWVGTLTSTFNQ